MLPAISPKASSISVLTSPPGTYRSRPSIRTRTPRCRPAERLQPPSPGVRKDAANGAAAAGPSRVDEQAHRLRLRRDAGRQPGRTEEHTSELQSLMRISYAVFCLKKKKYKKN